MLFQRVATAAVGAPVLLGVVYLGGFSYAALVVALVSLAAKEFSRMTSAAGIPVRGPVLHLALPGLILLLQLELESLVYPLLAAVAVLIMLQGMISGDWGKMGGAGAGGPGAEAAAAVPAGIAAGMGMGALGFAYLSLFGFLILLRALPDGIRMTYFALALTWAFDIGGYFGGRAWGRRRLAPRISPGKTVEGFAVGLLLAVAVAALSGPAFFNAPPAASALLGLLAALAAQSGDLLESCLKRLLGAKDSGGILPGHGGILDRFDSLLLVAPIVLYFGPLLLFL